jgi:hypothetical protein
MKEMEETKTVRKAEVEVEVEKVEVEVVLEMEEAEVEVHVCTAGPRTVTRLHTMNNENFHYFAYPFFFVVIF